MIYGAGGFAREVMWLAEDCAAAGAALEVACFVDDEATLQGQLVNGVPVRSLADAVARHPRALVSVAVGSPKARRALTAKATLAGLTPVTLVHPGVRSSRWNDIGEGTVICAGSILTCNITLGQGVQINLDCTVGHDVVMGDYATLAPGVHLSGFVHVGAGAYLGTGATVINGSADRPLVIGEGAVVGAGACVTKPIDPGATAVGVPAKPLQR